MKQNLSSWLVCLIFASQLAADEKLFPTDADFLNVKSPPSNAKGDGVADDTVAIQAALKSALDHLAVLDFTDVRLQPSWPHLG